MTGLIDIRASARTICTGCIALPRTKVAHNIYKMLEKTFMKDKSAMDTEEAKDMELDEEGKPVKKAGHTAVPSPGSEMTHKKSKGIRKKR